MLVRQMGAAGAEVRQHADFDAAGLAITGWLAAQAPGSSDRGSVEDPRS
jgi:hypothetical protein